LSGQPSDRPFLRHVSEAIGYLRLPTFSKDNSEIIDRERAGWEKPNGKEKVLIIDLRGNDGGDAAFDALDGWVSSQDLKSLSKGNRRVGNSCLYPPLRWGYTSMSSANLKPPLTASMQGELQGALDALFSKDDPACPAQFREERAKRHYKDRSGGAKPRLGKPTIMVVVDNECGSDCEYMTHILANLPETVVVGVNTFGVMQYIQPGYSALPNTRLPFRVALGTSDVYGDNRSVDGYGLDVDVLISGAAGWSRDGLLALAQLLSQPATAAASP
jgi:C-terminal processing protease CtpA/Prc